MPWAGAREWGAICHLLDGFHPPDWVTLELPLAGILLPAGTGQPITHVLHP